MTPAVVLTLAVAAHGQIRFADGVAIADVVSSVLAGAPDIELARLAVEAEAGARLLAASPFDLELRTALLRARDHLPLASARDGVLVTETVETRTSAVKSFRSGLIVTSDLSLARVRSSASGLPTGQIDSSVSVRVPLAGGGEEARRSARSVPRRSPSRPAASNAITWPRARSTTPCSRTGATSRRRRN